MIHHCIDGVFQLENFTFHIHRDLLRQIARRDGGRYFGNVSHLAGEISRHEIHRVSKIFPSAGDALDSRLAAKNSFRTHLARYARYFRRKRTQLIDHHVYRVLQLENLAFHIHRDFLRQVAVRYSRRHGRNVAHLGS